MAQWPVAQYNWYNDSITKIVIKIIRNVIIATETMDCLEFQVKQTSQTKFKDQISATLHKKIFFSEDLFRACHVHLHYKFPNLF
jgi:hypothetical protein